MNGIAKSPTKKLSKNLAVPFNQLFSEDFLTTFSSTNSFETWLKEGNISKKFLHNSEAFKCINLNDYVSSSTTFSNWSEMLNTSIKQWISKQMIGSEDSVNVSDWLKKCLALHIKRNSSNVWWVSFKFNCWHD